MLTKEQLAATLRSVNVEEVSRASGISTKTIYRLRHCKHAPTLDTVTALLSAIDQMKRRPAKAAA